MGDDLLSDLGPVVYAVLKGAKAYRQALEDAAAEYQKLSGSNYSPDDSIGKILSSSSEKISQFSDLPVSDFLKKYQKFQTALSLMKMLFG